MKRNFIIILCAVLLVMVLSCSKKKEEKVKEFRQQEIKEEWLPEIVPYLDSKPSAKDGQGGAVISPEGPFPAGSRIDFKITFTVGEVGIAPGGFVILQISPW